ncbi:MAG: flagellar basal-body rod protein FlgF [Chitinophagales bacterium]
MIRGLFIGASGMLVELRRADLIANNLANATTTGFKRDDLVAESFGSLLLRRLDDEVGPGLRPAVAPVVGELGLGAAGARSAVDWAQGGFTETGNPLDVALDGDGLFAVQTPAGERYTRDGSFTRDRDGYLVTEGGYRVLGERGAIRLDGAKVEIASDGAVTIDGRRVDRLRLVQFPAGSLAKLGGNLFAASGQAGRSQATVLQGQLERSNVNVVREMINLIAAQRNYDTNQRLLQLEGDLLQKAVTEVGRV